LELLVIMLAIGLGILTAGVAKRYDRAPLAWGIFGALLFIIALPTLFYLGRREGQPGERRTTRGQPVQVVWRWGTTSHLPGGTPEPQRLAATSTVVRVLAELGPADFVTLAEHTQQDESDLMDELDALLDANLVGIWGKSYELTSIARRLVAANGSGDDSEGAR
jgi:hypothetical protein